MGIYIQNMEMPKDYSVIVKIFPDGRVGTIPYVQWFKVELIEGTQAVPVPPHGKLGDLDTLQKQINIARNYGMIGKTAHYKLQKLIKEAPTIIPAELPVLHGTFAAASEQEALKRIPTAEESKT